MVITKKNKHARSIAALASLALVVAASPARAAEWFPGSAAPIASPGEVQLDSVAQSAGLDHVVGRSAELDLVGIELAPDRVISRWGGSRLVRLEQRVLGVPVLGGGVIVQIEPSGSVRRVGVDVARGLDLDTAPSLDVQEATDALELALGRAVPTPSMTKLVVSRMGAGVLLWQLDVRDTVGGSRYWVDAHHGGLVASRSLAMHAQGTVYEMNPLETPVPIDVELPLLDTAADPIQLNGWGGLLAVTQYVSGGSLYNYDSTGVVVEQTLVASSGEDFLYAPLADPLDTTDSFAHVNAYYHLSTLRSLFQDLGANVDDPSWKLTVAVNALSDGEPFEDAFATSQGIQGAFAATNAIVIGQGSMRDLAHDADIIKHELGHIASFVEVGSNMGPQYIDELGRSPFSAAIDEGIADYFACSHNDDAEWAEKWLAKGFQRDLSDTSKTCPESMNAEAHDDGEIIGSASWSIRELVGSDVADRLVWGALSSLLPGGSFGDFAEGLLATADDLVAVGDLGADERAGIADILAQRGLDNCGRIIRLSPGDTRSVFLAGLTSAAVNGSDCALMQELGVEVATMFHFSWTPEPGDVGLKANVHMTPAAGLDYTIFARADQPVHFGPGGLSGFVAVDQSDFSAAHTGDDGELIIDASSDPPFDPAATYDFVVMSRSCPDLTMELSVAPYEPPPPSGEGGAGGGAGGEGGGSGGAPADEDSPDDGCGCELAGQEGAPVPASLALGALAAALVRRRRRAHRHRA